jgi:hypothetical protein
MPMVWLKLEPVVLVLRQALVVSTMFGVILNDISTYTA